MTFASVAHGLAQITSNGGVGGNEQHKNGVKKHPPGNLALAGKFLAICNEETPTQGLSSPITKKKFHNKIVVAINYLDEMFSSQETVDGKTH